MQKNKLYLIKWLDHTGNSGWVTDLKDEEPAECLTIGWLVEEITGMPFQDALSREVWTQMGAESDALIWAGRYGIPLTSGGLMAQVRDLGRFGLLFTPSWPKVAEPSTASHKMIESSAPAVARSLPSGLKAAV